MVLFIIYCQPIHLYQLHMQIKSSIHNFFVIKFECSVCAIYRINNYSFGLRRDNSNEFMRSLVLCHLTDDKYKYSHRGVVKHTYIKYHIYLVEIHVINIFYIINLTLPISSRLDQLVTFLTGLMDS